MNQTPDNYPQTPADPVDEGLTTDFVQCLADWLKENGPCEQKAHRILSALAQESLKAVKHGLEGQFTAEEITSAIEDPWPYKTSPGDWMNWKDTVEAYWNVKENEVIKFAINRNLNIYPFPDKKPTKGYHKATYKIVAKPIPKSEDEPETVILESASTNEDESKAENPEKIKTAWKPIQYKRSDPGEVKLSWLARMIFPKGEFKLSRWKFLLMFLWVFGGFMSSVLFAYLALLSLMTPKPITTQIISILIMMIVIPLWAWLDLVKPWIRLFEDRIKPVSDLMLALKEKEAQMEVYREEDIRVIRIVRYSSVCPICGSDVYLDYGSPDYPRRMVGRCAESPREHVFSFDRVPRKGAVLRSPPL